MFDLTFAIHVDGAIENIVVKSDISWTELREAVSDKMAKSASRINLAYRFNTHPQKKVPIKVGDPIQFLEMMEDAKEGLQEFTEAKAAGEEKCEGTGIQS